MPRVKIGPALPDYKQLEVEIARGCAISTTATSGNVGMPYLGGCRLLTYPAIWRFASWLTGYRPTDSVTWMATASSCLIIPTRQDGKPPELLRR
jgi:hypothetical protein